MVGWNIADNLVNTCFCLLLNISFPTAFASGGSRLKRAEMSAHPTEWSICKRERGEDACLYRSISGPAKYEKTKPYRPADASKEEKEGGHTYCTSIGPSQDSTCCVSRVRRLNILIITLAGDTWSPKRHLPHGGKKQSKSGCEKIS